MPSWLWWRRSVDYERELPRLATLARHKQLQLVNLQASSRRVTGLFLLYSVGVYLAWLVVFLVTASRRRSFYQGSAAILAPCAIYVCRIYLRRFYQWRVSRQEAGLEELLERRKVLVEEYKERTNYNKIRELVSGPENDDPEGPEVEKTPQASTPALPQDGQLLPPTNIQDQPHMTVNDPAMLGNSTTASPPAPRTWMDRVVDIVLGENEQSPNNRYALICPQCHCHNGLAPYGELPDQVVYKCPYCGVLNGTASGSTHQDDPIDPSNKDSDTVPVELAAKNPSKPTSDTPERPESPRGNNLDRPESIELES